MVYTEEGVLVGMVTLAGVEVLGFRIRIAIGRVA